MKNSSGRRQRLKDIIGQVSQSLMTGFFTDYAHGTKYMPVW